MKVTGPGGLSQTGATRAGRSAGGEGFRVATPDTAAPSAGATAVSSASGVMGVEALIALQDVGSPLERRRRSVSRAGRLLDVLEGIKVALLEGDLSAGQMEQLARTLREQRAQTEDPKLEQLLDEIETRAAVEMAKLQAAARAA